MGSVGVTGWVQRVLHSIKIVYASKQTNCLRAVTDTGRQMAAGVGFLMHEESSHLLV